MSHEIQALEQNIADLRDQLAGLRDTLSTAPEEEEKRLEQKIRKLKVKIGKFDREHWELVSQAVPAYVLEEAEAEAVQGEMVESIDRLQAFPPSALTTEMLALLQEIRDRLDAPGTTAAAKLKGVISSVPPFVGLAYEAEIDTEQFFKAHFPTFRGWVKVLVERNAKKGVVESSQDSTHSPTLYTLFHKAFSEWQQSTSYLNSTTSQKSS